MVLGSLTSTGGQHGEHHGRSNNVSRQSFPDNTTAPIQNTVTGGKARQATLVGTSVSPFHPDVRRNPPEPGELVVHCVKARNLSISRFGQRGAREIDPQLSLTVVPDGGTTATCAHMGGGRHPLWHQVTSEHGGGRYTVFIPIYTEICRVSRFDSIPRRNWKQIRGLREVVVRYRTPVEVFVTLQ